eukprot:1138755-Rhodomonas_salina.2
MLAERGGAWSVWEPSSAELGRVLAALASVLAERKRAQVIWSTNTKGDRSTEWQCRRQQQVRVLVCACVRVCACARAC